MSVASSHVLQGSFMDVARCRVHICLAGIKMVWYSSMAPTICDSSSTILIVVIVGLIVMTIIIRVIITMTVVVMIIVATIVVRVIVSLLLIGG